MISYQIDLLKMGNIIKLLNSPFLINKIIIENFTLLDEELKLYIEIRSNYFGVKMILFENVTDLNIDSEYYGCSAKSSIVIDDISAYQLENKNYRIFISEDVMSFDCKSFVLL